MPENSIPQHWYEIPLNREVVVETKSLFQKGTDYLTQKLAELEESDNAEGMISVAERLKTSASEFWGMVNLPVEKAIAQEDLDPHLKTAEEVLEKKILASQRGFAAARISQRYGEVAKSENPVLHKYREFVHKVLLEGQAGGMLDQTNNTDEGPTTALDDAMKAIESGAIKPRWSKKELLEMYFDPEENLDYDSSTGQALYDELTRTITQLEGTTVGDNILNSLRERWGKLKANADTKYATNHPQPKHSFTLSETISLDDAKHALIETLQHPFPSATKNETPQICKDNLVARLRDLAQSVDTTRLPDQAFDLDYRKEDIGFPETVSLKYLLEYAKQNLNDIMLPAHGNGSGILTINFPGIPRPVNINFQWKSLLGEQDISVNEATAKQHKLENWLNRIEGKVGDLTKDIQSFNIIVSPKPNQK